MIDRAEGGPGDDKHGKAEMNGEVRIGRGTVVWCEQPARPLDDQEIASGAEGQSLLG